MLLYCSIVCFRSQQAFDILLKRNNYFKVNSEWHRLFSSANLYSCLLTEPISPERGMFDLLALKASFDKELSFMTELILERAIMTKDMILVLLSEG